MRSVSAAVLLMPCTTDQYFRAEEVREEARLLPNAVFCPIESDWGHRAGDPHRPGQEGEYARIREAVARLLATPRVLPTSVLPAAASAPSDRSSRL